MNIHFQQVEKKSQVFLYMLVVVVVFTVCMVISNTSQTVNLRLPIHSASSMQAAYGKISNIPVAIPVPVPPAEQVQMTLAAVPSSTPSPVPQAVPVPVPSLPR